MDHRRGTTEDTSFRKAPFETTMNSPNAIEVFQRRIIADLDAYRDVQVKRSMQDCARSRGDLDQQYSLDIDKLRDVYHEKLDTIERNRLADIAGMRDHWKYKPFDLPDKVFKDEPNQRTNSDEQQHDQTQATFPGQHQQHATTSQSTSSGPQRYLHQDPDFGLSNSYAFSTSEPPPALQAAETQNPQNLRFQFNLLGATEPEILNTATVPWHQAHLANSANFAIATTQQQSMLQRASTNRAGVMSPASRTIPPSTRTQQTVARNEIMATNAWVKYSDADMTDTQRDYLKSSGVRSLNRYGDARYFKDNLSSDYYEKMSGALDLQTLSDRVKRDIYRSVRQFAKAFYSIVEDTSFYYGDGHPLTKAVNGMAYHFEHQVMLDLPAGEGYANESLPMMNWKGAGGNDDIAGEE